VTTGAPLYLVSACASAEEFVAAFRRYADRTGLFVPIAEPFPQGRRGRIAIALKDGRIVLEGEIEIVGSSARPSPLYGRVGMTLKFVEPDAPTKTTLGELEKARLAMKPAPLSVAPRASEAPAAPRPTPPPIGGRIDASNALAECVAIGDLAGWTAAAIPGKTGDASSGKFVIPAIPQMGSARPKSPSMPPALQPKLTSEAKPPPLPGTTPIALPPKIVTPPIGVPSSKAEQRMTTMGMPVIDRLPAVEAKPEPTPEPKPDMPAISSTMTKQGVMPPKGAPLGTTMGMHPIVRPPNETASAPVPAPTAAPAPAPVIPRRDPTPLPKKGESITIPKRETSVGKATTLGMPIVRPPADTQESLAPPPPASSGAAATRRAHTPSTPPAPRHPTPYAPLPIVRKPASEPLTALADLSEITDVTGAPEPPLVGEEQRKTSLGVAMMTASPVETHWEHDHGPTEQQAAVEPVPDLAAPIAPSRSGGLRASEIMTAMKGEDWTMTPDASSPTVLPKAVEPSTDPNVKAAEEKSGPLPGDWAISIDPASPGGWSAPSKVEKPPELQAPPASGNRNIAVASAKAIEAVEWEEKPTGIGEALVQIDPTLMEPATPLLDDPLDDEPVNIVSTPIVDVPPPPTPPPPPSMPTPPPWAPAASSLPLAAPAPTPMAQPPALPPPPLGPTPYLPTPPPQPSPLFAPPMPNSSAVFPALPPRIDITDGNTSFFHESGETPHYAADPTDSIAVKRRRRTMMLVIAAAGLAVIATVVVILSTGGTRTKTAEHHHAATGSGSAALVATGSGSAQISVGSAHVETPSPPVDAAPPAPQVCNVDITTSPTGAELSLEDKTVLGTSPATVPLPCGVETKIYAKKVRYGSTAKTFTASADNTKLALRIAAPMFQIKVTSVPTGATIMIGNRVVGITPTTVKVQAFGSTTITLSKDGYTSDIEKIAPRANNAAHHVILKHATKKLR
jgi:hypothetical protein